MNILIIDNYDSFTYNLAAAVQGITGVRPEVIRNDAVTGAAVAGCDKLLLSPGPGVPEEAGQLTEVIRTWAATKSILGVCLGHQAIASVFGAGLHNLERVYHGVATPVRQLQQDALFAGIPPEFVAGRYHSWVVDRAEIPDELEIIAEDSEGYIMALRHRSYDVKGVQFHPESILTPDGITLLRNWLYPDATIS